MVACGSAYHVGMAAKYVMEDLARIPLQVELASEFRYRRPLLNEDDRVVIISRSGETADSLAALREAKKLGKRVTVIMSKIISVLDTKARDEQKGNFYHGLLLGLLRSEPNWLILSNAELGEGFSDKHIDTRRAFHGAPVFALF